MHLGRLDFIRCCYSYKLSTTLPEAVQLEVVWAVEMLSRLAADVLLESTARQLSAKSALTKPFELPFLAVFSRN